MSIRILLIFLVFSPLAMADRYFIENSRATGISDSDRAAVDQLIRVSVSGTGKDTVVENRTAADWILSPLLLKLGDAYVLSLEKKNKNDQVVYSQKMKATTITDLDTVAARLTEAVITQTSTDETADVTNITTEEENRNTRRFKATRQWAFGLGPGWGGNLRSGGGGFTFSLGYQWGLDPDFAIAFAGTYNSGRGDDESSYTDLSLGGEYTFLRGKHSPFVGARFGWGTAHVNDDCGTFSNCTQDRASGWSAVVTGGVKLFRTSTVNAGLVASYMYLFDESSVGNPSLSTLQFVVYY